MLWLLVAIGLIWLLFVILILCICAASGKPGGDDDPRD